MVGVPGVGGGAVDGVVALPVGEIDGDVGLAEDDRSGRLQAPNGDGGDGDLLVLQFRVASGGGEALDVEAFLDGGGNAEKGGGFV